MLAFTERKAIENVGFKMIFKDCGQTTLTERQLYTTVFRRVFIPRSGLKQFNRNALQKQSTNRNGSRPIRFQRAVFTIDCQLPVVFRLLIGVKSGLSIEFIRR